MGLALSLATAFMLTQGMKLIFGKPRPDLLDRCQPDYENVQRYATGGYGQDISPRWVLVTSKICQQTDMDILNDGFKSFPSGHASCKFLDDRQQERALPLTTLLFSHLVRSSLPLPLPLLQILHRHSLPPAAPLLHQPRPHRHRTRTPPLLPPPVPPQEPRRKALHRQLPRHQHRRRPQLPHRPHPQPSRRAADIHPGPRPRPARRRHLHHGVALLRLPPPRLRPDLRLPDGHRVRLVLVPLVPSAHPPGRGLVLGRPLARPRVGHRRRRRQLRRAGGLGQREEE